MTVPGAKPRSAHRTRAAVSTEAGGGTRRGRAARPRDAFLRGTTAIVTGASSGIGQSIALALAARGAAVALAARREDRLAKIAQEIERRGVGKALAVATDVTDDAQVARLVETVERRLGPVGILVNNAGQGYASPVAALEMDRLDALMRVNFRAAVLCTRQVVAGMMARRGGAIVNVGSISSRRGWAGGTPYVASKFALRGFALCLWHEVHAANVRVINLYPAAVATGMAGAAGMPSAQLERAIAPEDIGELLVALLGLPQRTDVVEVDVWPTSLHG